MSMATTDVLPSMARVVSLDYSWMQESVGMISLVPGWTRNLCEKVRMDVETGRLRVACLWIRVLDPVFSPMPWSSRCPCLGLVQ